MIFFKPQYRRTRFAGSVESPGGGTNVEHPQKPDWEQIEAFDEPLMGCCCQKLFSRFAAEPAIQAIVDQDDDQMHGYVCSRPGRLAAYVGTCMAIGKT